METERDLKALVESLMQSQIAENAQRARLEEEVAALQSRLSDAALAVAPAEARADRLEIERTEALAAHEALRRRLAASEAEVAHQHAERRKAQATARRVASAVEALVPPLCDVMLRSQAAAAEEPRLEADMGLRAAAAAAAEGGWDAAEERQAMVQANFEAALAAFSTVSERVREITGVVLELAQPLAQLRAAVRGRVLADDDAAAVDGGASTRSQVVGAQQRALLAAEAAAAQRASVGEFDESAEGARGAAEPEGARASAVATGAAACEATTSSALVATKFQVVVPDDAGEHMAPTPLPHHLGAPAFPLPRPPRSPCL